MDKVRLLKVIVVTCLIASMLCTAYAFTISVYPGFQNPEATYKYKRTLDTIKEIDINDEEDVSDVAYASHKLCWQIFLKDWKKNKDVDKIEIEKADMFGGTPSGYLVVDGEKYDFYFETEDDIRLNDQDYNTRVKLCSIVQDVAARVSREITLRYIFIISVDLLLIVALVIITRKQKENETADEKESSNL